MQGLCSSLCSSYGKILGPLLDRLCYCLPKAFRSHESMPKTPRTGLKTIIIFSRNISKFMLFYLLSCFSACRAHTSNLLETSLQNKASCSSHINSTLWKLEMKGFFPEKPGFRWIFSLLDSLMSNRSLSASWWFSHCWESPNVSLWCLFLGPYRWLKSPCGASFSRDSGSISPRTWLLTSAQLLQKYPESGFLRAYICSSQE